MEKTFDMWYFLLSHKKLEMSKEVWWKNANKPVVIGSVVEGLFSRKKVLRTQEAKIAQIWNEINDEDILKHTCVTRLHQSKLYVCVDSTAYMFELKSFHKRSILKRLKDYSSEVYISNIIFQVGDLKNYRDII